MAGAKQWRFRLPRCLLCLFAAEDGAFLCVFGDGEGTWRGAFQDSLTHGSDSLVPRAATMSLINRKRPPPPLQKKRFLSTWLLWITLLSNGLKKHIYKKETTLSRARICCIHL